MNCRTEFHPCTGDRPGAASDLVLLPGWATGSDVFADFLPQLCRRFHVTRVDLPGTGVNAGLHTGGSLETMTAMILDAVPLQAHWLGWSLGGMAAACAAANEPQRVRTLTTVAANLSFVQRSGWPAAMAPEVFAAFERDLERDPQATFERFLALQCQGGAQAREDLRRLRAMQPAPAGGDVLLDGLAILREADLRQQIASGIGCPSLWLYGAQDALVPAVASEAVARRLPQAGVQVLPGVSHMPFFAALPALSAAVVPFLETHS